MTRKRNLGAEILEGIRQIKSGRPGRVMTLPSVRGIRERIELSQSQFAKLMVAGRNPRALLDAIA